MIAMFLNGAELPEGQQPVISGQKGLSLFLVVVALVCIPWMLFPKPLALRSDLKKHQHHVEQAEHTKGFELKEVKDEQEQKDQLELEKQGLIDIQHEPLSSKSDLQLLK